MQISAIVSTIYNLTNTNSSSYTAANMLLDINRAYNRVVSLCVTADGRWQFDDENQTDFPIATTDLISGQNDYALAITHLQIRQVELKLASGLWITLKPIDEKDFADMGISPSYYQTILGLPFYYDKLGNSVILYPTPNYSQSASLKLWFERGVVEFSSADVSGGTKQPGFNTLYHELIPLWVAHDYFLANDQTMTQRLLAKIQMIEKALLLDYGTRDKDDSPRLTTLTRSFK